MDSYCPSCGQPVTDPGAGYCPSCGAPGKSASQGTGSGAPSPAASSVPFEDTAQPFFSRLFNTITLSLSRPSELFSNVSDEGIGAPLGYGVIVGTLSVVFGLLWQMLYLAIAAAGEASTGAPELVAGTGVLVFFMALSPALVVAGLFINTAIYHVMLLLVGDGARGFNVTLRAVAYGSTPNLLTIIPVCGGLIAGIWSLVLVIMGAYYGHRTDGWRAILAYFLPLLFCCCLAFWILSFFGIIGSVLDR